MTPRTILKWPAPILSQPCDDIEIAQVLDGTLKQLVLALRETARVQFFPRAMGLAAPQIGEPFRVFVLDDGQGFFRALVNPAVIWETPETETLPEGCLSLPGVVMPVERPVAVGLGALDDRMEPVNLRLTGTVARVALHEMDHLAGRTILDYHAEKAVA